MYCYGVYIVTNESHSTLYVGMSSLLPARVAMHAQEISTGFAHKYRCKKLLYYAFLSTRDAAYRREKEIKGWRRQKKMALIVTKNPHWKDLTEDLVREARDLMR